jgi:ribosomal protein S18 acetylase RimI-like enzyme
VTVAVRPLTEETWDALAELFREGGDPHWCWCQYWRLRSKDFGAAKVSELRERLRGQAARGAPGVAPGEPPGLVAFEADRAVGWVSLGPRDGYERIVRSRVIPKIDDRPVWSIVCFAVSSSARGQGVGQALLDAAIEFARGRGVETLEAYPVMVDAGAPINPESAFTGTLPMFERAGFEVVAERASDPSSAHTRVVVRRDIRTEKASDAHPPVDSRTSRSLNI